MAYGVDDGKRRWTADLGEPSLHWVPDDDPAAVTFLEPGATSKDPYLVHVDVRDGDVDKGPKIEMRATQAQALGRDQVRAYR